MKFTHIAMAAALGATLVACRSPFAEWDESGPPEDPQKIGLGVHGWPLFERDFNRAGVRTDVLWPVSSVRTSPDGELRRASILVPLVLVERDGARSRFGVRPLFDVESDTVGGGEISDVDLLWPFIKWRTEPDAAKFEFRPFWWSGHRGTNEDWTVLFPIGGSWRFDENGGWFAGPLAGGWTEEGTSHWWAALGLVSHEENSPGTTSATRGLFGVVKSETWDDGGSFRVFPLFDSAHDEGDRTDSWDVVWPGLVHHGTKGDETTDWGFPLWYHRADADSETTVVAPLWLSHESPEGSTKVLFPLYGATHEKDLDRTYWGGNLLVLTDRPDGGAVDVLWPIFHHESRGDSWNTRLFPLLSIDRSGDSGHTHLWPLFGKSWNGDETSWSTVFPLFGGSSAPDRWSAHAFPVLWLKRSPSADHTHVWPLFGTWRSGDDRRGWTAAWPLIRYEESADGWEADAPFPLVEIDRRGDDHETAVFPFVKHTSNVKTGAYEGDVLWLLSNWEGDGQGRTDFRFLWRLVQATQTPERSLVALNPFFRHETNARGDDHWSALFGLVARTREAQDVRWRFLWFLTT